MRLKIYVIVLTVFITTIRLSATDSLFQQKKILETMEKVATWQLNSWKENGSKHRWWDWTNAAGYTGLMAFSKISKVPKYVRTLIGKGDSLNWQNRPRRIHCADYCIRPNYSLLYAKYNE